MRIIKGEEDMPSLPDKIIHNVDKARAALGRALCIAPESVSEKTITEFLSFWNFRDNAELDQRFQSKVAN
ncbi:uncharacterized protein N7482_007286 [Penicillium canariense]|uniref:Uncharacterized protein n=1 Tax=Penicillium canariense TaxID=189055 RepID=A0A9W9HWH9_9EURO|nr:uncharacterized protein N7482_007286 [Penicillium canariense]KAJ5160282.1 hypothetical protein N7482_007286 [Penicillium canariense]